MSVGAQLAANAQQQQFLTQHITHGAATIPGFHGSDLQQQLVASLSALNRRQAELMASAQGQPTNDWPDIDGGRERLPPASPRSMHLQSMAGGGSTGGDISQSTSYRNMVAAQAQKLEEERARRGGSTPRSTVAEREQAHRLARDLAPTYSHSMSEDAELGQLMLSMVGGAIRKRLMRFGKSKKTHEPNVVQHGLKS